MTKHELEQLVMDLTEQLKALQKANARERKELLKTIKELKGENDPPRRRTRRKAKEDTINEQMSENVKEHHDRAIRLFAKLKKTEKTPTIDKFVEEHGIFNLADMDEATFIVLIRHHFNRELADAYATHQMNMRVYHSIVHYFDDSVDIKPLEVTDEMRMEAEQVTKELEETAKQRLRLNPTAGAFHLRGRAELETFFNEQVVDIVNRFDDYAKLGMSFPKGFILEGPPGCGKTFAVERLAEHLGWHTERIDSSSIGSSYIHQTAQKIEESFQRAADNAPSILIIDEMDAFMPNRAGLSSHDNHSKEEVDSFLKCLQTAAEKHILVVGMTNLIDTLDPAVLRTGRMGTHIKVGMPAQEEVEDVLAYALEKRPHADFNLQPYAGQLLDHPLSDVTHVVDEAAMSAVRAYHDRIEEEDLAVAIDRLLYRQRAQQPEQKPFGFAS